MSTYQRESELRAAVETLRRNYDKPVVNPRATAEARIERLIASMDEAEVDAITAKMPLADVAMAAEAVQRGRAAREAREAARNNRQNGDN
jgi:hypothetical protein